MSILQTPEYVNAGSRVVWTGQFNGVLLYGATNDVIQGVVSDLLNNYQLSVEKQDNNISLFSTDGAITLYLRTNIDRGDGETDDGLTDILNNVNDAFTRQHATPTTASLSQYTPASQDGSGASGAINTGTPLATVQQQQVAAAKTSSPSDWSLSGWWDKTVAQVEAGSVGFIVGGVAVIGVIVYLSVRKAAPV